MTPLLCERCGARPADVRVHSGGTTLRLCRDCLAGLAPAGRRARADLSRFFNLLARPRPPARALELVSIPGDPACPGCGLRYEEFAARGLAGCARCYDAFAPALLAALQRLRG